MVQSLSSIHFPKAFYMALCTQPKCLYSKKSISCLVSYQKGRKVNIRWIIIMILSLRYTAFSLLPFSSEKGNQTISSLIFLVEKFLSLQAIIIIIFLLEYNCLQCCASFCCTITWISCMYTCVPSLFSLPPTPSHPTPLEHHRTRSWAPCGI